MSAKNVSRLITKNRKLAQRVADNLDEVDVFGKAAGEFNVKNLNISGKMNNKKLAKIESAKSEGMKEAIELMQGNAPKKLTSIKEKNYSNPVDKARLKELRKRQAEGKYTVRETTEDFRRTWKKDNVRDTSTLSTPATVSNGRMEMSGASNFDGSKTESNLKKQSKTYAKRQYNKEKGRLEYESENAASFRDRRKARKDLNSLNKDDFNPKNKSAKNEEKMSNDNFVYKMAAMGVGGGLVLSMANSGGQQSNSQLYGQQY